MRINVTRLLKAIEITAATAAVTTAVVDMVTTISSKCRIDHHASKEVYTIIVDEFGVEHMITAENINNFPEYWEAIASDVRINEFIRNQAIDLIVSKSRSTKNDLNNMIEKENERFRQQIAEAADIQELIKLRGYYDHDAKKTAVIEGELKERVLKYISENDVK